MLILALRNEWGQSPLRCRPTLRGSADGLRDDPRAGDVEGLVSLYEPDAAPRPTLRAGDLAVTSSVLRDGTVTVEVARRQRDGTWLWVIDQPNVPG
jgi:hypothetical protein